MSNHHYVWFEEKYLLNGKKGCTVPVVTLQLVGAVETSLRAAFIDTPNAAYLCAYPVESLYLRFGRGLC